MRKIIAIALCLIMILCIVACKDNDDTVDAANTDSAAATTTAADDNPTDDKDSKDTQPEAQVVNSDWTKLY